jgi:nucleotide-binding universal stress UspA family protein
MYKKILTAVDGSAASLRGLNEAISVAKATGGRIMLVHVVDELVVSGDYAPASYYEAVIKSIREAGAKILEEAAAILSKAGVPYEQKLLERIGGRAADIIVSQAREWPAELIVLGTHGRRGLKRLVMGSDAELILRLSPVPVLMVRDKPESP